MIGEKIKQSESELEENNYSPEIMSPVSTKLPLKRKVWANNFSVMEVPQQSWKSRIIYSSFFLL